MTQLVELSDLHVFIRPIFMETIVLNGIVTRQHQGHDRMSTDFCTHIVISNAKVSHMDRLRLGAEFADYVLFLDKFRVMLDGATIYRVNDETFVAWDNDSEYRLQRSRLGMVRDRYNTHVVPPWMAINADDTPPVLPEPPLPLGIPAQPLPPSSPSFGAPNGNSWAIFFLKHRIYSTS